MFRAMRLIVGAALVALVAVAQAAPPSDDSVRAANLMTEGLKHLGQGSPEALHEAAADFQEAADLWQKLGETSKQLEALLNLAGAYTYLHEFGEASRLLNQSRDLARATGNRAAEGTALASLAMLHNNPADQQKAMDELAQALKLFEDLGDKNAELQVLGMQGWLFERTQNFPAAVEAYERGLALSQETKNGKTEAMILLGLARVNELLPQQEASEKAAEYFAKAVPLLEANSDRGNEAAALWGLGQVNDKLGRIDQAREAYLKALPLLPNLKNSSAAGLILLDLAMDEEKVEQPAKALDHYEQALRLLPPKDESHRWTAEMHIGKVRETLGDIPMALEAYQAAASVSHEAGIKSDEGVADLRIGTLRFDSHAWQEALNAYSEAEKLFETVGDRQDEVSSLAGEGGAYASLGEYKRKLDCSLGQLALVQASQDSSQKAAALLAVGDSYNALHESKKALDYLSQALTLNEHEPAGKATVLAEIGEVYYGMGDLAKAVQAENEALTIFSSLGNPSAEAKVRNDLGLTYSAMGEKAKALEAFQKDLEIAKARKDIQQESATLNNLARLHQDFGDNKEGEEFYSQSLALVHQSGDRSQEAATLSNLGMLYHSFGEEQKALDTLNESLVEFRSIQDRHGAAVALNNLALVYSGTGETQKALEAQNSALTIFRDLDSKPEIAGGLANLGSTYQSVGLYDRAESYFSEALTIQKQVGDEDGEAATLNNLGVVMQYDGKPDEALTNLEQAMQLAEKLGNRVAQARLLASIAIALTDTGDSSHAIEKLNQSLQISRETGDIDDEAVALHNLGSVYSQLGDFDQALKLYGQVLDLWHKIRNESAAAKALSLIAKAERAQGKLEPALDRIDEAIRINESLRGKLTSQDLRTSYLATVTNPYEIKIELLMQLNREHQDREYIAQALETSERARARSLLELLTESRADIRQGVDPELLAQERSIGSSLSAKALELRKLDSSSSDSAQLQREIEDCTAEYERVEAQIRIKSPGYAALTQPQPLTLKEIQQQVLDPDTLLLEYSLGEEHSYLWAVTQNSLSFYELPPRSLIEADAQEYFDLVANDIQNRQELDEKAARLSETLLGPVASEMKTKRLVIVSDGQLENVPFAALPMPSGSRPLIADHEILNEPSASAVAILRRETTGRKIAPKLVAVLADPVFDSNDVRFQGLLGLGGPGNAMKGQPGQPHDLLQSA
ncbi:MAG: tetratricopeptide repeat protein, partial [Verrucomicrobia bacterium]|nr:tetratricopeptide repeat protein [Verrucomicrobiota bacterium]